MMIPPHAPLKQDLFLFFILKIMTGSSVFYMVSVASVPQSVSRDARCFIIMPV